MVVFAYGVIAYVAFVLTSLYSVGFVEGVAARTLDGTSQDGGGWLGALVTNTVLLGLFAAQHTFMGRPVFRNALKSVLPEPVERSTHVLVSSLTLMQLLLRWRPIPFELWSLELNAVGLLLEIVSCTGFAIAFAATFQIGHFELFGVAQALGHARGDEQPPTRFDLPYLYRWVRHPIYFGLLVALWCSSVMTVGRVLFATFVTAWIVFLARLEERDLAREHREYRAYQARVPMLLPRSRPLRAHRRAG